VNLCNRGKIFGVSDTWGWAGSVKEFLSAPYEVWLKSLSDHHLRLWDMNPSGSQIEAWKVEHRIVVDALRNCVNVDGQMIESWSVVFEYELPLEGGRRPDVIVMTGASITVLEFKSGVKLNQADVDQTIGYVRDLSDYHSGSHQFPCMGILVLSGASEKYAKILDGIPVVGGPAIHPYLMSSHREGKVDLQSWLDSPYEPLPSLVEAARRIFRDEELPHVYTAISAGIPETVELLGEIIDAAAESSGRVLALVTGVPGAGKTLVGLRLVHERTEKHGRATFLSGNGPLVQVLQDALQSRVFVRDLHAFIKSYALNLKPKTPSEHVIVFDEAQRAWDAAYMNEKKGVERSEPELLIEIGERITDWAALIGLVGEGQEIHSGEESGIKQWETAASPPNAQKSWVIHCPPKLASTFESLEVVAHEELDLNVTLRSRRAEDLHSWVQLLLEGSLVLAHRQSLKVHEQRYQIYLTRDLDEAKRYARLRYDGEPSRRYGFLASSHAKKLVGFGVDNSYQATSTMNVAKWYNASNDDPKSSNSLRQPVTEFGCQGLELDLPIVCWGDDYLWNGSKWALKPINRRYRQDDPQALLRNTYRVLMTRGRDGLVIFLPTGEMFDQTEVALLAAGVKMMPIGDELAGVASSDGKKWVVEPASVSRIAK
jgi:hypothetical protein